MTISKYCPKTEYYIARVFGGNYIGSVGTINIWWCCTYKIQFGANYKNSDYLYFYFTWKQNHHRPYLLLNYSLLRFAKICPS